MKRRAVTPLTESQWELVVKHRPMVIAIALQVADGLPAFSSELEDLIGDGTIGLIDAARRHRTETNIPFSSFAAHRVRGAIIDGLRRLDFCKRDTRRHIKAIEAASNRLRAELGREPAEEEIAHELGWSLAYYHNRLARLQNVLRGHAYLMERSLEGGYYENELAATESLRPDAIYQRKETNVRLKNAVRTLDPRRQRLLVLYYRDELSMKEVGKEMGVNESRISQMHKDAIQKLRREFGAEDQPRLKAA